MPSIEENRRAWGEFAWTETQGDEWSHAWGGSIVLWWAVIFPRIRHLLPAATILEIAPGFGRITQFLRSFCDELIVIDISKRCIEGCKERFKDDRHITYHLGDGDSLAPISDEQVDLVFTFDSLVHCEADVLEGYLTDLAVKLTPQGSGFIHHSNFAALVDPESGDRTCDNEHWRGESVSADLIADICDDKGLVCVTQELINWGGTLELTDCFTVVARPDSPLAANPRRRRWNNLFQAEAIALGRIAKFAMPDREDQTAEPAVEAAEAVEMTPDLAKLDLDSFRSHSQYQVWFESHEDEIRKLRDQELSLATPGKEFKIKAHCYACGDSRQMKVTWDKAFEWQGRLTPNWREQLLCPICGLNARMRSTLHLLETHFKSALEGQCYVTEEDSPLFSLLRARYPMIIGSEYLDDGTRPGEKGPDGVHHQDVSRLSFDSNSLDLVVSLDVVEHLPQFQQGIGEFNRVLKAGGKLVFTTPFVPFSDKNIRLAQQSADGEIEHLHPPEYHHDPYRNEPALAFHRFGWELLEEALRLGFSDVTARFCRSLEFGYFGAFNVFFTATKIFGDDRQKPGSE